MLRLRATGYFLVLFLLMCCAGGCVQGNNHVDEEKDSHFLRGRELAGQQDFKGAAAQFECALEDNPHSAAAQFELGWLCDTKFNDFAAAIYHYDRLLQLRPNWKRAALVQDRIRGCREELARGEFLLPLSHNLQKDVDRLNAENLQLKQQLEALRKLAASGSAAAQMSVQPAPMRYAASSPVGSAQRRIHIVKAHETITSISAEYGLAANAILAANPQINPRRLRIGQTVSLP